MLTSPHGEHTATSVARATGIHAATVAPILVRLVTFEWLETLPGVGTARPYRLTQTGIDGARDAIRTRSTNTGTSMSTGGGKVWTLAELEQAVARGEQPPSVLRAARQAVRPRRG